MGGWWEPICFQYKQGRYIYGTLCSRWGPSVVVVGRGGGGSAVLKGGGTLYLYSEFFIPVC